MGEAHPASPSLEKALRVVVQVGLVVGLLVRAVTSTSVVSWVEEIEEKEEAKDTELLPPTPVLGTVNGELDTCTSSDLFWAEMTDIADFNRSIICFRACGVLAGLLKFNFVVAPEVAPDEVGEKRP